MQIDTLFNIGSPVKDKKHNRGKVSQIFASVGRFVPVEGETEGELFTQVSYKVEATDGAVLDRLEGDLIADETDR
jgi:hypothetical protein